jgi:23S rRNA (uridine2552-2'-O)-methyltransferase
MTRWYTEKKKEHFYKEAKRVGYRARSSFKLLQIQSRYNVIKKGDTVIDLGAAPGGWSQVAKELVEDQGVVIGIDLSSIDRIPGVTFLQGDMTKESSLKDLENALIGKKADVVISDMSPDISGNYSVDHARSVYLSMQALKTAETLLRPGGNFVCKVFSGEDLEDFIKMVKERFQVVKRHSPPATRKSSSEIYIIAKLFHN